MVKWWPYKQDLFATGIKNCMWKYWKILVCRRLGIGKKTEKRRVAYKEAEIKKKNMKSFKKFEKFEQKLKKIWPKVNDWLYRVFHTNWGWVSSLKI
jgi:hypothetical protein